MQTAIKLDTKNESPLWSVMTLQELQSLGFTGRSMFFLSCFESRREGTLIAGLKLRGKQPFIPDRPFIINSLRHTLSLHSGRKLEPERTNGCLPPSCCDAGVLTTLALCTTILKC